MTRWHREETLTFVKFHISRSFQGAVSISTWLMLFVLSTIQVILRQYLWPRSNRNKTWDGEWFLHKRFFFSWKNLYRSEGGIRRCKAKMWFKLRPGPVWSQGKFLSPKGIIAQSHLRQENWTFISYRWLWNPKLSAISHWLCSCWQREIL